MAQNPVAWLSAKSSAWTLFTRPSKGKQIAYPSLPGYGVPSDDESFVTGPSRTQASRGTDIFVGRGKEIRYADMRELKANDGLKSHNEYKVLHLPGLDFDVKQLEISPDALYMAIVGEHELAVCVLPGEGFLRREGLKARVPLIRNVGRAYHNSASGAIILRVLWHPMGCDGGTLVVLSSDSYIRTYDLAIGSNLSFESPDLVFDLMELSGRQRVTDNWGINDEALEPASMCFASGRTSWNPFTLNVLMRCGTIYALSPVVPSRWTAQPDYTQRLSVEIAAQVEERTQLVANMPGEEQLAIRHRMKWINDVLQQEQQQSEFGTTSYTRPEVNLLTPALQGPFMIGPTPKELASDTKHTFYQACDIIHIEAESASIMCVLFSHGKLDIFLQFEPVDAKWLSRKRFGRKDSTNTPILATFDTVDLKFKAQEDSANVDWPVFVRDVQTECTTWFVAHNNGVTSFEIIGWLKELDNILETFADSQSISQAVSSAPQTRVMQVISQDSEDPIDGTIVVYNAYTGYVLVAASASQLFSAEFELPPYREFRDDSRRQRFAFLTEGARSDRALIDLRRTPSPGVPATCPLADDPFSLPSIFSEKSNLSALLAQEPRQAVSRPINLSADDNARLVRAREALKVEFAQLMDGAQKTYDRVDAQRQEYQRQISAIHDANTLLKEHKAKDVPQRLQRIMDKQAEMKKRTEEMLRKLAMKGEGRLTAAEKQWFREVNHLKAGVEDGLEERRTGVLDALEQVCVNVDGEWKVRSGHEMILGDGTPQIPTEVREKKMWELREMLAKQDATISVARTGLESLLEVLRVGGR